MKQAKNKKFTETKSLYRIYAYYPVNQDWIFIIQNIKTLKKRKISSDKLIMNLHLLSRFDIKDILTISYAAAESQIQLAAATQDD